MKLALAVSILAATAACRASAPAAPPAPADQVIAVRATLEALYAAFCFDPGEDPDWEAQRRICLPGAAFVAPIRPDRTPAAVGIEAFLADFAGFAASDPYRTTGFHERIVGARIEVFGGVAHACVAFEGFVPGEAAASTRGLDSVQLVHDGTAWRLVSFTTQYEREGLVLPERLLE